MKLPRHLGYLFDAPRRLTPEAPALFEADRVVSYRELDERCDRVASGLVELGVRPEQRVALFFDNDHRFVECFFGAIRTGAVAVPLNIRMGDEALGFVLEDSESAIVLVNERTLERARRIAATVAGVRHVIASQALPSGSTPFALGQADSDSVCMQPYTSGSTGKPKGVLLAHAGQIWNADVLRKALHVDAGERALVAVPLYHKNAMIGAVKPFLLAGGSLVILPGFDAVAVIEAIERYEVTYLTGVPAMYKRILAERKALERHDVRSVRYAVCGSAEVPEELLEEFRDVFGAPIAESYGLTEGGPVPVVHSRWGLKRRGSCGMAFPGCDVKLVSEDGSEVEPGTVGELWTRNPGLTKGYWKRPDATAEKLRDGWLRTGDLMRRDEDGFYYFVGRKDDMINVAGENVYPKEVENVLLSHPNVRDACVVPAPHEVKGEVPVAFVVEESAGRTNEEELKAFFLERGAPYAHPRRVVFLDALPLGGTGKIDRRSLRDRARSEPAGRTP